MCKWQDQAGSQLEYVVKLKTVIYRTIELNSFLKNQIPRKIDIKR